MKKQLFILAFLSLNFLGFSQVSDGTIKADLSVSGTGAVNYTVPIDVPPGLNGVQPEIALTFDSQSGNGLAGWGWNLSGISVITRIASTEYHDDKIDPVDFDLDDRFALDGQRLILKTGTYGTDGAIYQTERYSNIKIISLGTHPDSGVDGPREFKVIYPDGSIAFYGNTVESANSRSKTDYAISYWENPQGVRIDYLYNKVHNALSIDKIRYGGRSAASYINEIEFSYNSRTIPEMAFVGGEKFIRDEKLDEIKVKGNNSALDRMYYLSYNSSTLQYKRLSKITEKTGDLSKARDISFTYDGGSYDSNGIHDLGLSENFEEATTLSLTNINQENAKVISLDMTGDGEMDFIVYPTTGVDAKKKIWLLDNLHDSNEFNYTNAYSTNSFDEIFPVSWLNQANKLLSTQGIALVHNENDNDVKFKIYSSGGAVQPIAYKYEKVWNAPTYKPQDYHITNNPAIFRVPLEYISGDFDGDGLSDIIALEKTYTATTCQEIPSSSDPNCANKVTRDGIEYCCYACNTSTHNVSNAHLIKLDRRISSGFASNAGSLGRELKSTDKLYTMDVNGDGKTDILQIREGETFVYSLNSTNNSLQLLWQTTDTDIKLDFQILPGDYNGDGKSDFMIPTALNDDDYVMFLSTGSDFEKLNKLNQGFDYKATYVNGGTNYGYNLIPVDMNGDGKSDIIEYNTVTYDSNDNGTQYIRLHQNTKKGYITEEPIFIPSDPLQTTGNLKHFPIPVFLSSDQPNKSLEFATISNKWLRSYKSLKDHREDVTLKSVVNNGVTTTINYDLIDSNNSALYTAGSSQIYPYVNVDVAPSFKVVRELTQVGDGITRTQKFEYVGAISHASGLGFIGFQELKRTNWYGDGVGTLWTISKHDPLLRNAVTEQWTAETSSSIPAQYISKTDYFYDYTLISNPGSPSAPQFSDYLNRNSSISGQHTDQAEQYIHLLPGFYANGANGAYLAELVPPSEQPGAMGYAGVTDIRLNKIETDNGLTGVFTTETYTYDAYNNPITTYTTFPGGSKTVTLEYSNNASANDNNYHIGRPTKKIVSNTLNGNSFSSEEQYTFSGNLVSQIKKKGNGTSWLTEDFLYDVNGNVKKKTLSGDGVTPRIEEYEYVGYGERFLTKSKDIEGMESSYTYDPVTGNLLTTTDPYNHVTTFVYDGWDRLEKETDYLGKETIHEYLSQTGGGLKKNTNYATGAKDETIYNAFGWVIKSGSLSLDSQWMYQSFEYDVSGRKTKESEPHNGSASQWNTFGFDVNGRLISQLLATGKSITITYSGLSSTVSDGTKSVTTTIDALGNVAKVQDPGGTVDYTYHGNGSMKTADYDGNVVSIGIDGWGRKISLSDPAAGSYSYTYNSFGELLTETTPKGTTTYIYDAYGRLDSKEIKGDLTDLFLDYQYDDADTRLLNKIVGTDHTNTRSYSYDYVFDSNPAYKGRLVSIKENTGLAEFELEYLYDAYGRVDKETQISKNLSNSISSSITTRNVYDASGILSEIWNDGTPDKLWELDAINARGQALTVNLGNGMTKTKIYDSYGYVTKIEDKESGTNPTVALHTEYVFNTQRGTLTSRENFGFSWDENFGYDQQDRLTTISGDATKTMTYDTRGRITNNTALGDYAYDNGNKYRLTDITPNTAGETYFQAHPTQQVSYNAFKKPVTVHETGHGRVSFEYGPLMNRSHAFYGGEQEDESLRRYQKYYSAIIPAEIVEDSQTSTTKIITYVGGDAYSAPIAHIKKTGTNSIDEYHYLHRDYLGSILAITDADGDLIEERQFGAWGSVDKFLDSNANTTFGHESLLGRGYTGHEHFFEVSLIHMNGRMYDPQLGRFLSPDNYIQDPYSTQSYNRYGYVLNNPLMYVDPSGEAAEWLVAAIVGGAIWIANSIWGNHDANPYDAPDAQQNVAPVPVNNNTNTNIASSASGGSRVNPKWDFGLPKVFQKGYDMYQAFNAGFLNGFADGGKSSWNFIKSLGTRQGWKDMGQGLVDLADMGSVHSFRGAMLRSQLAGSIGQTIEELPNKNAYEWGYGVGYGTEKIVEGVLLSKGAGFAANAVKNSGGIRNLLRLNKNTSGRATTWNGFQEMTAGQFSSRAEAGVAWSSYKQANGIVTGTARSQAQKSLFLRNAASSGMYPKWMNQWLQKGKVPPGYSVDHKIPLSIGGPDVPSNMRLLDNHFHYNIHHARGFYRPWD